MPGRRQVSTEGGQRDPGADPGLALRLGDDVDAPARESEAFAHGVEARRAGTVLGGRPWLNGSAVAADAQAGLLPVALQRYPDLPRPGMGHDVAQRLLGDTEEDRLDAAGETLVARTVVEVPIQGRGAADLLDHGGQRRSEATLANRFGADLERVVAQPRRGPLDRVLDLLDRGDRLARRHAAQRDPCDLGLEEEPRKSLEEAVVQLLRDPAALCLLGVHGRFEQP